MHVSSLEYTLKKLLLLMASLSAMRIIYRPKFASLGFLVLRMTYSSLRLVIAVLARTDKLKAT